MINKSFYVYILTNKYNTVLYTGITNNLVKRIWEHKNKAIEGFTSRYNVNKLVYYEIFSDPENAITREKQIKGWLRQKKINLIESKNTKFEDLYSKITG